MQVTVPLVYKGLWKILWIHGDPRRLAVLPVRRIPSRLRPVEEGRHLGVCSCGDHDIERKEVIVSEDNRRVVGDFNPTGILKLLNSISTVERARNSCTADKDVVQWSLTEAAYTELKT